MKIFDIGIARTIVDKDARAAFIITDSITPFE